MIKAQPLLDAQFGGRGVLGKIELAGEAFPLLIREDVLECQSEPGFPSTEAVLNKVAIESNLFPSY